MTPPLKLVLTAAGCPGASTLIRMLKANGEREISIHGVDMRPDAVGRFLCDGFSLVPSGTSPEYVPSLLDVVRREEPDVLLVQSSSEVEAVARARAAFVELGVTVLVGGPEAIAICNDKAAMHAALRDTPVLQPRLLLPASVEEFVAGARELGYPGVPVCFKPPIAKGSRGFHVVSEGGRPDLLERRGGVSVLTLEEAAAELAAGDAFPPLLLMEYIEAPEFVVDALVDDGEIVLFQAKTREAVRAGLAMSFRTVAKPDLVEASRHICRRLRLDQFVSIQFMGEHLIEVNPRVSTFVYQEDFILPYLGIKYARGELDAEGVALAQSRVRTSRRSVRYFDQVFWDE
ncbi:MAG TPA: ATP-grasp domain-containing protein [Thermoleophilia bacterium]|nr:ATP-grasp domain-containing protein [Thermoleophilia bacterium]